MDIAPHPTAATLRLPEWLNGYLCLAQGSPFLNEEQAMMFAIKLSEENVKRQTGGPFGAVVIDSDSGQLISAGVNVVRPCNMSAAHAEVVAITMAQQRVAAWDLSSLGKMTLVTSCEPCAMCYGALQWANLSRVVCGANKSDAESVGFDEGVKPDDWVGCLEQRGMTVRQDLYRDSAKSVLQLYRQTQGVIYGNTAKEGCC